MLERRPEVILKGCVHCRGTQIHQCAHSPINKTVSEAAIWSDKIQSKALVDFQPVQNHQLPEIQANPYIETLESFDFKN